MSAPMKYAERTALGSSLIAEDHDLLVDMYRGFTPSGVFTSNYAYLIVFDGVDYHAVSNAQTIYGGPSDAGGVDGADAAAVIQACLDNMPAEGGIIHIKAGAYTLDTTIDFTGHQCLTVEGEGCGDEVGNTILTYTGAGNGFEFDTQHDILLHNFRLKGTVAGNKGISMIECWKTTLSSIVIADFNGNQFFGDAFWGNRIVDCEFDGNGVADTAYFSNYCFQNLFERTLFYYCDNGQSGCRYHGLLGTWINCEFSGGVTDAGGIGIKIEGGDVPLNAPFNILGCNFEGIWDGVGISLNAIRSAKIENCYFTNMKTVNATDVAIDINDLELANSSVIIENCNFHDSFVTTTLDFSGALGWIDLRPVNNWGGNWIVLTRATAAAKLKTYQRQEGHSTIASGGAVVWDLQLTAGNSATTIIATPDAAFSGGKGVMVAAGEWKDHTGFNPIFTMTDNNPVVGAIGINWIAIYDPREV